MADKLHQLERRVDQIVGLVDRLEIENSGLRKENDNIKTELAQLKERFRQLQLKETDRASQARTRLSLILSRLEELENLQS
jgi:hypothetical protein